MKKYSIVLFIVLPALGFGQGLGIGLKAGLNFANVSRASSINNSSRTGFHAGLFLAPPSKGIISSRTEIIFSRQGYDYKTNTNTGTVDLNYIVLPQFMAINITRFFQLQFGAQMAYLINAKADSTKNTNNMTGGAPYARIMDYYNRFDYGFGGGIEIHPVGGLLIGARLNISLSDVYKEPQPGQQPSFFPTVNVKNNVFQAFAGWQFGKKSSSKKKEKK